MDKKREAIIISRDNYNSKQFDVVQENTTKTIEIRDVFSINENNIGINKKFGNIQKSYKNWAIISSNLSDSQIDSMLKNCKSRTKLIDAIVDKVIENNINGIVIDFNKEQSKESTLRFIIEIAPRLREFGITTAVVLNENIEKSNYINIVDYIVE